jgi:hypothetical protein
MGFCWLILFVNTLTWLNFEQDPVFEKVLEGIYGQQMKNGVLEADAPHHELTPPIVPAYQPLELIDILPHFLVKIPAYLRVLTGISPSLCLLLIHFSAHCILVIVYLLVIVHHILSWYLRNFCSFWGLSLVLSGLLGDCGVSAVGLGLSVHVHLLLCSFALGVYLRRH